MIGAGFPSLTQFYHEITETKKQASKNLPHYYWIGGNAKCMFFPNTGTGAE
jgi:hypothetical protein